MQKRSLCYQENKKAYKPICYTCIVPINQKQNKKQKKRRESVKGTDATKPMKENKILNLENIEATNAKKCTCKHPNCDNLIKTGEGYGLRTKYGQAYFCRQHNMLNGLRGYTCEDFYEVGSEKATKLAKHTIGNEFECMVDGEDPRRFNSLKAIMLDSKYIDTQDSTVDIEFKAPIMEGLGTISKICDTIEREGFSHCFNNDECGAHIHGYTSDIFPIRAYYHSLFLPLYNYIDTMDVEKRVAIFGRDFAGWAQRINDRTDATRHANFVNTEHYHTIEFRLPRFASALQYMQLVKFWREATFTIDFYFTNCLQPIEGGKRKAQAQKIGAEIVEIAKKYFE